MSDYNDTSKKRLTNNIEKKFKTTIIGCLEILEKEIGHLWGHEEKIEDLTDDQIKFLSKWYSIRDKIMDLGFSNLRAAKTELSQYSCRWNRYITHFEVTNKEDRKDG